MSNIDDEKSSGSKSAQELDYNDDCEGFLFCSFSDLVSFGCRLHNKTATANCSTQILGLCVWEGDVVVF